MSCKQYTIKPEITDKQYTIKPEITDKLTKNSNAGKFGANTGNNWQSKREFGNKQQYNNTEYIFREYDR